MIYSTKKLIGLIGLVIVLTLGFSISTQSLWAQWTEPAVLPPGGNVVELLNGDSYIQTKIAGLWLGTSNATPLGLIVEHGNVGIGNVNPQGLLRVGPSPDGPLWAVGISGSFIQRSGNAILGLDSGDVGIGIQVPTSKLQVNGNFSAGTEGGTPFAVSNSGDIVVTGGTDGNWAIFKGSDGLIGINSANNVTLSYLASSRVGIGIDPTEKLDVNGNIRARGNITADGTISASGINVGGAINAGTINATNLTVGGAPLGAQIDYGACQSGISIWGGSCPPNYVMTGFSFYDDSNEHGPSTFTCCKLK
jgi:hypothetical protein